MLRKKIGIAITASAFLFVGCVTPAPEVKNYTFKQAPAVNQYKSAIKKETALQLKNPEGAIYSFGTPFKGYMNTPAPNKVKWTGWVIPYDVSTIGSSGKHTVPNPYRAAIMDEGVFVAKRYMSNAQWIDEIYSF